MAVETTPPSPSAKIGGTKEKPSFKRETSPEKKMVTVFDKEGNPHSVSRQNANDLVRHVGWSWRPKGEAEVLEADEVVETSEDPDQGEAERQTEIDTAMEALQALRDEATALGVAVDNRWGKKKLTEAIKAAKEQ
jgi:hypothetical protein